MNKLKDILFYSLYHTEDPQARAIYEQLIELANLQDAYDDYVEDNYTKHVWFFTDGFTVDKHIKFYEFPCIITSFINEGNADKVAEYASKMDTFAKEMDWALEINESKVEITEQKTKAPLCMRIRWESAELYWRSILNVIDEEG